MWTFHLISQKKRHKQKNRMDMPNSTHTLQPRRTKKKSGMQHCCCSPAAPPSTAGSTVSSSMHHRYRLKVAPLATHCSSSSRHTPAATSETPRAAQAIKRGTTLWCHRCPIRQAGPRVSLGARGGSPVRVTVQHLYLIEVNLRERPPLPYDLKLDLWTLSGEHLG